jgi:hypothetical protein
MAGILDCFSDLYKTGHVLILHIEREDFMASTGWTAATTAPGAEYAACLELERLGASPYLPQVRRAWRPPGAPAVG